MNEKPIERLNYYNGQRLEAEDFRLEQDYHVRIQRWLSKSLFLPGVADGLEVHPSDDKKKVLVTPGLALDDLGRAIVSVNQVERVPQAPFLCVRYLERKDRVHEGQCTVRGTSPGASAHWGGPERIVSEAEFVWRRALPGNDTRELVIAELELDTDCTVKRVLSGARRHAVAAPRITFPYGVVGEKDINQANPKTIYFHIKHSDAQVFLHLRASRFSTLHYTEIPSHSHRLINTTTEADTNVPFKRHIDISPQGDHHHDLNTMAIPSQTHSHGIESNFIQLQGALNGDPNAGNLNSTGSVVVDRSKGTFFKDEKFSKDVLRLLTTDSTTPTALTGSMGEAGAHVHTITIDTSTENTGATGIEVARGGKQLRFPSDLRITFIGNGVTTDITQAVLDHLEKNGDGSWNFPSMSLGDGSATHPLVSKGTGEIPLHALVNVGLGENTIKLAVQGPENGGCIHYNLYVE